MPTAWEATMNARVREFSGWHLAAFCAGCRVLVQLDVDRLSTAHAERAVCEVVSRLRCSRCGEWPASVTLASGHEGDGRAERQEVRLIP